MEEFVRFYKITRGGRLHRKSTKGFYEEIKGRDVIKNLHILTSKSIKRIE